MKIGILTLPLQTNYGGLLQAFALQTVLKKMGHEVWNIDRKFEDQPLWIKLLSVIKRSIIKVCLRKDIRVRVWTTVGEERLIARNTIRFIKENICSTKAITSGKKFSVLNKYGFEAYIVGSDQVWRPEYTPCITNYFFDFTEKRKNTKRIAYAASFGVGSWAFTAEQTIQCASLIKQFDAVSVREDSAVALCKDYLHVDAVHLLDPTMLLKKEDYSLLVKNDKIPKSKGTLMTYVLDKSPEKSEIIKRVAVELNIIPFTVMPKSSLDEVGRSKIAECIFPPVTEWIRGFMDAEYVVTDSFHGTVFSILFNKPFIAIGNQGRGMTRFTSLLKLFKLDDRLIYSFSELSPELIRNPIDFENVNMILDQERSKSFSFLNNALK